jgi:hypothetical protein
MLGPGRSHRSADHIALLHCFAFMCVRVDHLQRIDAEFPQMRFPLARDQQHVSRLFCRDRLRKRRQQDKWAGICLQRHADQNIGRHGMPQQGNRRAV